MSLAPSPELASIKEEKKYLYRQNGWKDQLLSYDGNLITYNALGNPIKYLNNTLEWTRGYLLDTYYDGINSKEYKYDYNADGIRISKLIDNKKTNYYLDGSRILAQDDGNLICFHYGVEGVVGFTYQEAYNYFYKKNIQGDVIGIFDDNNKQIVKYEYDAWGNHKVKVLKNEEFVDVTTLIDDDNIEIKNYIFIANLNPFRYRSYYFDSETGLYYCNSRYYSPKLCRFISSDRFEFLNKNKINGLNLYAYCGNNPVNRIDDYGNSWKSFWKKVKRKAKKAGNAIGDFFEEIFDVFTDLTYNIVTVKGGNIFGGYESGTVAGITIGDRSKPFSFYTKNNADNWWEIWEYEIGIRIKVGKFSYSQGVKLYETNVSFGWDNRTVDFQIGLDRIGVGSSYTENGVTTYTQYYINTIPTAFAVAAVIACVYLLGPYGAAGLIGALAGA